MPLRGSSCLLEFRPAAGRPEGHRDAAPGCGAKEIVGGAPPQRRWRQLGPSCRGFPANTLMNYVVRYAVDLQYDAYSMPVNAVDLRSLSCRSILSVINMRAR